MDVDGDGKAELLVPDVLMLPDGSAQYLTEYVAVTRRGAGDYPAKAQAACPQEFSVTPQGLRFLTS